MHDKFYASSNRLVAVVQEFYPNEPDDPYKFCVDVFDFDFHKIPILSSRMIEAYPRQIAKIPLKTTKKVERVLKYFALDWYERESWGEAIEYCRQNLADCHFNWG